MNDNRESGRTRRTSRRDFLRTTVAAAAATTAIGAAPAEESLADPRPVPVARPPVIPGPREPALIGVIGTGGMGTEHCNAFLRLVKEGKEDVRIVALADVCDPRMENARKKVEEGQGSSPAVFRDYRQLLADPAIHGVLIAAPEHWHAKMAEDAVEAGKAVYLEKPMTLRLKEALRLYKVTQENPEAIVQVGTQYMMEPAYHEARRLIDSGAIGKAVWSQTGYCRNSKDGEWLYYEIDPNWAPGENLDWKAWCGPLGRADWDPAVYARWRRYRKYSTGIIGDLLVHRMTPLAWSLNVGWPTRVVASGGHYVDKVMENHDQVNMNIEFEGEHTMVVAGSTANEQGYETMIRGHKGSLYLNNRRLVLRPEQLFAEELEEKQYEGENLGDSQNLLRLNWIESIRTRKPPASPVEFGTKVMVMVDLATRSLWEGGAFGYDPRKQKVKKL